MSGSVNMKEASHEAKPGRSECYLRKSNSNTPIPSTGQQRDALPIICVPCTDGEREEGSHKIILQRGATSVAVR